MSYNIIGNGVTLSDSKQRTAVSYNFLCYNQTGNTVSYNFSFTPRPIRTRIYGDLVYKFKKIMGRTDFSDQFRKRIIRHKRFGYDLNPMRQSACLVINQSRRLITLAHSLIARRCISMMAAT